MRFFTKNAFERYCATGNANVLSVAACDLQVQRSRFAPRTKNYAAMEVIVNQTSYTAISYLDLQTYNLRVHFSSCAFNLHWWIDHDLCISLGSCCFYLQNLWHLLQSVYFPAHQHMMHFPIKRHWFPSTPTKCRVWVWYLISRKIFRIRNLAGNSGNLKPESQFSSPVSSLFQDFLRFYKIFAGVVHCASCSKPEMDYRSYQTPINKS